MHVKTWDDSKRKMQRPSSWWRPTFLPPQSKMRISVLGSLGKRPIKTIQTHHFPTQISLIGEQFIQNVGAVFSRECRRCHPPPLLQNFLTTLKLPKSMQRAWILNELAWRFCVEKFGCEWSSQGVRSTLLGGRRLDAGTSGGSGEVCEECHGRRWFLSFWYFFRNSTCLAMIVYVCRGGVRRCSWAL